MQSAKSLPTKLFIGCDPEVFLWSDAENKYKSAVGRVGGTKSKPRPFTGRGVIDGLQEDNVAAELNIGPARTCEAFVEGLDYIMKELSTIAAAQQLRVKIDASALFDPSELLSPEAMRFGCEPDYDAWTGGQNQFTGDPSGALRVAGGHIHVGTPYATEQPVRMVRAMDLFLGVPSVLMDKDTRRRQMYGKAGAFRIKNYGIEYRTLSNFWLMTKELQEWAFTQTARAVEWALTDVDFEPDAMSAIPHCINNQDHGLADFMRQRYDLVVVS